jgi:hypothetical protein
MTVRRSLVCAVGLFLIFFGLRASADAAPKEAANANRQPVRDPVCVGWDGGWIVYRYSDGAGQWQSWRSDDSPLPRKAFCVAGPHAVAVIDPFQRYGGWLFDLHGEKWNPIPISPMQGRTGTLDTIVVAFINDRLLVWGMTKGPPHGAILDPKAMQWKPIAEAPVAVRFRAATAVIGEKLVIWGGYGPRAPRGVGPLSDGAVYDVSKDTWEKMADAPGPPADYGYVWTAWKDRFALFGGRNRRDVPRTGLIYDPATKSWDAIVASPFDVAIQAACTVHEDQLFLWSGNSAAQAAAGKTVNSPAAVIYDFKKAQWQQLPDAPIPPRALSFAQTNGSKVTVWGGWDSSESPAHFFRDGATYDFAQGTWRKIPDLPADIPYALHPGW